MRTPRPSGMPRRGRPQAFPPVAHAAASTRKGRQLPNTAIGPRALAMQASKTTRPRRMPSTAGQTERPGRRPVPRQQARQNAPPVVAGRHKRSGCAARREKAASNGAGRAPSSRRPFCRGGVPGLQTAPVPLPFHPPACNVRYRVSGRNEMQRCRRRRSGNFPFQIMKKLAKRNYKSSIAPQHEPFSGLAAAHRSYT